MFPAKLAGVALIVLRCCVTLQLVLVSPQLPVIPSVLKVLVVASTALVLLLGTFTPVGCMTCVLLQSCALQQQGGLAPWLSVVPLTLPVVLLLLGPGAYSLDAHRYGRRLISGPRR